jgi:cell division protein FtsL
MRGRVTLFWILLAAAVGFGLFQVKYKVQTLEDDLRQLNAAITAEQEQLHVLSAEWAYLNRPARLEELSARHLPLRHPTVDQIRALNALPDRPEPTSDGPRRDELAR